MQDLGRQNSLICVSDRVSKVQQIPQSAFPLVRTHDLCLHSCRTQHYPLEHVLYTLEPAFADRLVQRSHYRISVLLKSFKLLLIPNRSCLNHLSHPIAHLPLVQRLQKLQINVHSLRLPESTYQILAHRHVYGRLAADAAVDHGKQRGRNLAEANTTHVCCGDVADHVADHAAAEC